MAQGPQNRNENSDMIDKNISFDKREMHKTWPLFKGCILLILALLAFVWLSIWVFKTFF